MRPRERCLGGGDWTPRWPAALHTRCVCWPVYACVELKHTHTHTHTERERERERERETMPSYSDVRAEKSVAVRAGALGVQILGGGFHELIPGGTEVSSQLKASHRKTGRPAGI